VFEKLGAMSPARRWLLVGSGVLAIFLLGVVSERHHLRSPFGAGDGADTVSRPKPAEFLYLDNGRVGAYLAQLNGGIAKSERLTEMLRTEERAGISGGDIVDVGASAQRENFIERQVTPTAAANFFRLLAILRDQDEIEDVKVTNLDAFESSEVNREGSFVFFRSSDVRTPIFANPYLVVRQAGTMKALFPTAGMDYAEREEVEAVREAARSFAGQVGPNPRMVFALTPRGGEDDTKEMHIRQALRERRNELEENGSRKSLERVQKKLDGLAVENDEEVKFLLPVRYRQLTDERSLIKNGGGNFKVVGIVTRVFKGREGKTIAYRDSPTWETWRNPLEHAPADLLEKASLLCDTTPHSEEFDRAKTPGERRTCVLDRLREQTEIPKRGAVILPIAIYK